MLRCWNPDLLKSYTLRRRRALKRKNFVLSSTPSTKPWGLICVADYLITKILQKCRMMRLRRIMIYAACFLVCLRHNRYIGEAALLLFVSAKPRACLVQTLLGRNAAKQSWLLLLLLLVLYLSLNNITCTRRFWKNLRTLATTLSAWRSVCDSIIHINISIPLRSSEMHIDVLSEMNWYAFFDIFVSRSINTRMFNSCVDDICIMILRSNNHLRAKRAVMYLVSV